MLLLILPLLVKLILCRKAVSSKITRHKYLHKLQEVEQLCNMLYLSYEQLYFHGYPKLLDLIKKQKRDYFLLKQHYAVSHCSMFQQTGLSILLCTLINCQIKIHYWHLKCATAFINCWLKGERLKGEKLHFSPMINTNFKYKWDQNCQNWEIRGQS